LSKIYVEKIPIKAISKNEEQPFINLVEKILTAKQQGKDSRTLQKKIDELVYKLYDISEDEQKLIEGK